MIKIEFEKETQHGIFRDALYLAEDHGLTDEQIELLKDERVTNWINAIVESQNQPTIEEENQPPILPTLG